MAYGGASAAMVMLVGGLWATDHWPTGREENCC